MGSLNLSQRLGAMSFFWKWSFTENNEEIMKEIKGILESVKRFCDSPLPKRTTERREKRKGKEKSYLQRHPPYLGQSALLLNNAVPPTCDTLGVIPMVEAGMNLAWCKNEGKSLIQSLHFIWQTHAFKHVVLGKSLAPFPHRGSLSHLATRNPACCLCL